MKHYSKKYEGHSTATEVMLDRCGMTTRLFYTLTHEARAFIIGELRRYEQAAELSHIYWLQSSKFRRARMRAKRKRFIATTR